MNTNNNFVLITGATSGIGYELAKLFAKDGYSLLLVSRDQAKMNEIANAFSKGYGVRVETIAKDLFLPESPFEVYEEVKARNLKVEILVNNAGHGCYGEFKDNDINKELAIIQLNISSLVVLTKKFLLEMISDGRGRILNVSSIASKSPGPLQAIYHATKAFVQSFTEAIRDEVKDTGIVVTALLPGATATDFFRKAGMLQAKNVQEGKLGDAETVALDGYNALMKGDDMVISGFKNKVQVAMSNVLPDRVVAAQVHQQQEPVSGDHKK